MTQPTSADGRVSAEQSVASATVDEVDADLPGAIDRTLAGYLAERTAAADELDADFAAATEQLRGFVLSDGKRIRPHVRLVGLAWRGWR